MQITSQITIFGAILKKGSHVRTSGSLAFANVGVFGNMAPLFGSLVNLRVRTAHVGGALHDRVVWWCGGIHVRSCEMAEGDTGAHTGCCGMLRHGACEGEGRTQGVQQPRMSLGGL